MINRSKFALYAALAFGTIGGAHAVEISAQLSSAQEVPPTQSAGTGQLTGNFDPATRALDYNLAYQGLTGPATAAHLHGPAPAGKNAPVMVPFTVAASPISGHATLTEPQAADLMAGNMYANIHTAANPGGEIRGQVSHK